MAVSFPYACVEGVSKIYLKFGRQGITQKKAYKNLKCYGSDKPELTNIYELPDWLFHDLDRKLDFHVISKDTVPLEEQFWYCT